MATFWYLSKYASLPQCSSVGTRGFHLFKEISALGHNCIIITSDSNLLAKSPVIQGRTLDQRIEGVQVRWIKTFKYIKARSLRRILSWLDFEVKVLLFGLRGLPEPEAVVVSSLSLLTILNGFLLRRKYKCEIIFEVRDIWPLTLIVEGNFSKFNPWVVILGFIEYLGYKYSDEIVGTMPNLKQHVDKVLGFSRQVHCIPIGFDCGDYRCPNKGNTGDINFKKPLAKFLIGYVGSIGVSNALDQLFKAAEKTLDDASIHYLIVGTGDLEHYYRHRYRHLSNVTFKPKVPRHQVPKILKKCDVLYFSTHPSEVWNYGQSLNKLVDYMVSGKPIIGSYTGFESMVNEAQCGIFVPSEDANALAKEFVVFSRLERSELHDMGARGKQWIYQHRTYRKLGLRYLNEVLMK